MDRRACDPYSSPGTRQLSYNKGLRAAGGSVLRITPKLEKHYQFQFTPALINNIISTTGSIANNNYIMYIRKGYRNMDFFLHNY